MRNRPGRSRRPPKRAPIASCSIIFRCAYPNEDDKQLSVSAKDKIISRLSKQLDLAADLRASTVNAPEFAPRRRCLRVWQAQRLAHTHADLLSSPRFGATASFFLTDLYGPEDLSRHEAEIKRITPIMTKLLPASGLETVADAMELNTLSEKLDAVMLKTLGTEAEALDAAAYGQAYRFSVRLRSLAECSVPACGLLDRR